MTGPQTQVDEEYALPLELVYTNHRSETARRRIIPGYIYLGTTEHHSQTQWLLHCFDVDKNASRDFAIKDCDFTAIESTPGSE